ncbi:hypothetical protein SEVCU127_1996 [Staphylococcus epidermidis VCU127]|nr:hypothetical protein SEVCU127_1996 [Staphylococcus epidermidis VCU127]
MARVESLKRKMTRLIIAIIVVSVGLVFLLQILESLYTLIFGNNRITFSLLLAHVSVL